MRGSLQRAEMRVFTLHDAPDPSASKDQLLTSLSVSFERLGACMGKGQGIAPASVYEFDSRPQWVSDPGSPRRVRCPKEPACDSGQHPRMERSLGLFSPETASRPESEPIQSFPM